MIPPLLKRVLLLPRRHALEVGLPALAMDRPIVGRLPAAFGDAFQLVHGRRAVDMVLDRCMLRGLRVYATKGVLSFTAHALSRVIISDVGGAYAWPCFNQIDAAH